MFDRLPNESDHTSNADHCSNKDYSMYTADSLQRTWFFTQNCHMKANTAPQYVFNSLERTSSFVSKSEYLRRSQLVKKYMFIHSHSSLYVRKNIYSHEGWSKIEEQTDIVTPMCWKQRVLVHYDLQCPSENSIQSKYIKLELLNSGSIARSLSGPQQWPWKIKR